LTAVKRRQEPIDSRPCLRPTRAGWGPHASWQDVVLEAGDQRDDRGDGAIASQASRRSNILSGAIGNVLEWYDFAVYGTLAPILGKLFFPADDPVASLLAAFGVFAVGYGVRPLGGILLGYVGDRIGRKPALMLSIVMMGGCTSLIGLLPTHAGIGTAAAALLVALRVLQGLSVGGEYPGSIVFLAEHAPAGRRGFYASWPMFGSTVGFLLGSAIASLMSNLLGEAAFAAWGWRVPFLLGAVIAVCGATLRRHMTEPAALATARPVVGAPVVAALRDHWRPVLQIIALSLVNAVGFYMLWVYATSYLTERMHIPTTMALDINTLSLVAMLPAVTIAAALSDRIGRKPVLYFVSVGSLLLAWPLWWLMQHHSFVLILASQIGFAVLYGAGYAGLSAVMVETFPAGVRCSASAIGYNLCLGLFGGTTPLVATYLVQRTADDFSPAYYLMATAVISLIATIRLRETAQEPLPD
jgi:MFS transporter, MHS family, proline/betaine transporter